MKKSIFTFFIFILLLSFLSSCFTSKKGGCNCPGMSKNSTYEFYKKA